MIFLFTFFVEKTRFLSIFCFKFRIWDEGILDFFKSKTEKTLFLLIFVDISTKNWYFLKKHNWSWLSLPRCMTGTKDRYCSLNLTNILKSATKNVKKGKIKKNPQILIFKYVIEYFKTNKFYFYNVLAWLSCLERYKGSKFLIFICEMRVNIWNISTEKVISTEKNRIFSVACFWIKSEHLEYLGI